MKTKLLLLLIPFLASAASYAQCSTSAFDFGNNTSVSSYNINGNVDVTLNTDNTVTLDLGTNFTTASGPDVRAYFVASNGASDATIKTSLIGNLENFQFGLVSSSTVSPNGAKSFTVNIPNGVNIEDYDTILFYCLQFNQFWDFGKITAFSNTNCSVLSIEDNSLSQTVSFYPNPSTDKIEITNDKLLNLDVSIFSILGNKVLEANHLALRKQIINLSTLKSGVYLIQLKANGQSITKKLVKR